jgi:hypothetical protein
MRWCNGLLVLPPYDYVQHKTAIYLLKLYALLLMEATRTLGFLLL